MSYINQYFDDVMEEPMNKGVNQSRFTHCDPTPQEDILARAADKRTDPMHGGRIGYIPFGYHLLPLRGLAKAAAVMRAGERAGRSASEWRSVPVEEHINHAISHLIAYLAGRMDDHHLANAVCRVLMAADLDTREPHPEPRYEPQNNSD